VDLRRAFSWISEQRVKNFPKYHQHAVSYNREVGICCAVGGAIYQRSQICEEPL